VEVEAKMNKKTLCILICTCMVITAIIPVTGLINTNKRVEDKIVQDVEKEGTYEDQNQDSSSKETVDRYTEPTQSEPKGFPLHVFNGESRTLVSDTTVYPYSAICEIDCDWSGLFNGNPITGKGGSGFIILNSGTDDVPGTGNAHHIMTCGHVIYNDTVGRIADFINITLGRMGAFEPFGMIPCVSTDAWAHPEYESDQNQRYDYAVVRLPITISDVTGYFTVGYPMDGGAPIARWAWDPIRTAGYPADVSGTPGDNRMFEDAMGHSRWRGPFNHFHKLDVTEGQSGSPVWFDISPASQWPGGHALSVAAYGVATLGGDPITNRGPYFTKSRWEEVVAVMNSHPPAEDVVDLTLELVDFTTTGNRSHDNWWCIQPGGDTYSIDIEVSNIGTEDCTEDFRIHYILNSESFLSNTFLFDWFENTVSIPSYGNPVGMGVNGVFESWIPEGSYDDITIHVDALNNVDEWNEDNNQEVIRAIKADITKPVFDPWGYGYSFTPSEWVNTLEPTCTVVATDELSGINPDSLWYRYSTNGLYGLPNKDWIPCNYCTPDPGGYQVTVVAEDVPFKFGGHDSATDNVIQFKVGDFAGNYEISNPYVVKIDTHPPGPVTVWSTSHPVENQWKKENHVEFEWAPPTSSDLSGIQGYQHAIVPAPILIWTDVQINSPDGITAYETDVESGEWYFHIAAVDNANNRGIGTYTKVRVDYLEPGPWHNLDYEETSSNCYTFSIEVDEEHSGIWTGGGWGEIQAKIRLGCRTEFIFEWGEWRGCRIRTVDSTTYELWKENVCFPSNAVDKRVQFKTMDQAQNWGTSSELPIP